MVASTASLLWLGTLLPVHAEGPVLPAAAEQAVPMAVGAKLDHGRAGTRLSLDLSSALVAKAYVLEAPDRVIIDLPEVNFQLDPGAGRVPAGDPLVRSFRFGLFAPGRSRIVIDLAAPATVARLSCDPIADGDPSRLVVELTKTDRAAFHKAVLAAAPEPPLTAAVTPAGSQSATNGSSTPVIVIDPGHGGVDPGASGLNGVLEKDVVFDFASKLAEKLQASGRYTVVMTRADDTFVSLNNRVKVARDANAALFVSIHADALAGAAAVTGATVYTSSDKASDAEAARVAEAENRADSVAGVESAPVVPDVSDILFDLTRRETRTYSHLFQRTLVGYWQKIARLNKNPERAAGFRVLQAPDVPSVLLELGYLSSEKDARTLTSPEWRDGATASIVNAVDMFFAPRQSTGSIPPAPAQHDGTAPGPGAQARTSAGEGPAMTSRDQPGPAINR